MRLGLLGPSGREAGASATHQPTWIPPVEAPLCLNHNGGDSGCQWERRRHADGGEEGRLELGHGGETPQLQSAAKANASTSGLMS